MIKYNLESQIICHKRDKFLNKTWWNDNVHKLALIALETQTKINLNILEGKLLSLSVMIVDNQEIKELNAQYRNIVKETDVLSFPAMFDSSEISFNLISIQELELGDIVISMDKLKQQAQELNHSIEREAAFLFVHGFLHLLGYDHEDEIQANLMFSLQNQILEKAEFSRG